MPRRWADGLVLGLTGLAFLGASWVWPRCEPSAIGLRRLGLAAFFAVVSVLCGRLAFKEAVPSSTWLGLALIVAGGLVIQFGRAPIE